MYSRRLQALILIILTTLTLHSYFTAPRFDGILAGPFSVPTLLGMEYFISLISWIAFSIISICKGVRSRLLNLYTLFMVTFLIYSFPRSLFVNQFYIDTTGFMLEARHVTEYGWFQSYQGGLESSAHALFTGILSQVTGINWYILTEWLPHAFMFITVIGLFIAGKVVAKDSSAQLLIPLLFLGTSFFAALQYNRQSYAFPIHVITLAALLLLINNKSIARMLSFIILFLGLLTSHPGSSLNIVMLVGMTCLAITRLEMPMLKFKMMVKTITKEHKNPQAMDFALLFLIALGLWFMFQFSVSGSIISFIKQIRVALRELFAEPLLTRAIMPGLEYTPEGRLYIELRMRYGQFIIVASMILAIITLLKYRNLRMARVLSLWILSDILGIGFLVYAKRWMQVPFMYLSLVFPLLIACLIVERREVRSHLTAFTIATLVIGILLQPILMWGPAPFVMPPSTDVAMGEFIASHSEDLSIAHIGSHGLMPFYLGLENGVSRHSDLFPTFIQGIGFDADRVGKYRLVGVFFRAYAKAGFFKFDPSINTAIKDLSQKLSDRGYSQIYIVLPREWVLFRS